MIAVSAAALAACGLFGRNNTYTKPVLGAAADRNSRRYIASMVSAGNSGGFWIAPDPVEFVNLADGRTPLLTVARKVAYHQFPSPYPWQQNFRIEPLSDAHSIVVQTQSCRVYEAWNTSFANGVLSAYSGANWSLREPFAPLRPGTPSAMSSGLSLYGGMVRWEEVAGGAVRHALVWAAPAGTVAQWSFVSPASDAEGIAFKGSDAYQLPYGARLRLRSSFDVSRFGPQSAAIARAMKTYGIYLADTARGNELYNALALDGTNRWDRRDLASLDAIHISDFDVVALHRVQRVPGR
ncbi:MAG TPA: hypothetical protein VGG51_09595 [Candidatus Cybelea sp.]